MIRRNIYCAVTVMILLVFAASASIAAAPQAANFAGTWQMTMEGGGRRGGGGGGQGGGRGRGGQGRGFTQTLTVAQNGNQYKVTHTTPRGDNSYDATVSGNTISWTEMFQGRDGNSITIDYKATVDGDSMTGTMGGGQFSRQFTAKRSTSSGSSSGSSSS